MAVFRIAVTIFAMALIVFGLIWTISPLPFGFVLVAVGLAILISVAPAEIRWLRRRWRWFDRVLHRLEKKLPGWIAKRLRDSDYDHAEGEEDKERARKKPAARSRSGRKSK